MVKIKIETGAGTRLIGELEDGIFTSHRQSSKHLYNKLNAWGIDCKAFDGMLANKGLHTVRIVDTDTQITYATHSENFKKHGSILQFKPHRVQVFLPLDYWTTEQAFSKRKGI